MVSERLLSRVWKSQWVKAERLCTSGGERLRVLFPGRENSEEGPDFRNAVIKVGDSLTEGDVEIHIRASYWRSHSHHLDPNYNGVVLHVVLWDDEGQGTTLQNGRAVPVLALTPFLDAALEELSERQVSGVGPGFGCHGALGRLGAEGMGRVLDEEGERRFLEKARRFEAGFLCVGPEEVLYGGLMEALGYERNKEPFRELAWRMPCRVLTGFCITEKRGERQLQVIQALLFGTAGLLPSQRRGTALKREDEWARELEGIWEAMGLGEVMGEGKWRFFRVRPENLPTRRIGAASHLLQKHLEEGLLEGLLHDFLEVVPEEEPGRLAELFILRTEGYWASHWDFGWDGGGRAALLGRGRAGDMVVNVLLPFFFALAEAFPFPGVGGHALETYRRHPRLGENHITREMALQLLGREDPKMVNSARRQQGLIQLYKTRCRGIRCGGCPMAAIP